MNREGSLSASSSSATTTSLHVATPTSSAANADAATASTTTTSTSTPGLPLPPLTAFVNASAQLSSQCSLLVATAIFEGTQLLRQPRHCRRAEDQGRYRRAQRPTAPPPPSSSSSSSRGMPTAAICHVAFVDWQTERLLKQVHEPLLVRELGEAFIGCWQLLRVGAGTPYVHAEANSLAVKLLLPHLFPSASASLWVDASRQLRTSKGDDGDCASVACSPLERMASAQQLVAVGARGEADGAMDVSLILRRHQPLTLALNLSTEWWREWEGAASASRAATPYASSSSSSSTTSASSTSSSSAPPAHVEAARSSSVALASLVAKSAQWRASVVAAGSGFSQTGGAPATPPVVLPAISTSATPPRESLPAAPSREARWPITALNARRTVARRPPAPRAETTPAVAFAAPKQGGGGGGGGAKSMGFGSGRSGSPRISDGERDGLLRLAPSTLSALPCGFMTSSAYDAAAAVGAASTCDIVTLTAIFDAFDNLIQPAPEVLSKAGEDELRCFFALVDRRSYDLLVRENADKLSPAAVKGVSQRVGVWSLVLLEGRMPFPSSRRNSRVPKMLAHRLFPRARYALWIDSKLRLHQPASALRKRFLPSGGGAVFAAYRNLKRDFIDEERDWIWRHKCAGAVANCPELIEQWASYEADQPSPDWPRQTVAIEGSLLLQDLRSPLHNALFCGWFNEYLRYGERDQMAISYVMHRMGLTVNGSNASRAVRLIERSYHYLTRPSLRPLTLVLKLGHRSGSRRLPPA